MKKYYYSDFAKKSGYITINESVGMHGFEEHTHDFFEIVYIRKGQGQYEENGIKKMLFAGDLLLVTPKDRHSLKPTTRDFAWTNCLFLPDQLFTGLSEDSTAVQLLSLPCFPGEQIEDDFLKDGVLISKGTQEFQNIMTDMSKEYFRAKEGFEEILQSLLYVVLIRIKRNVQSIRKSDVKWYTAEHLKNVVNQFIVESNALPPLRLETVAKAAGMTSKYFSEIFKKKVGVSFSEYVRDRRLVRAADLLKSSDVNVFSVMEYVGYRDSKTFYKLFKEKYGMTPSAYRDNIRKQK